MSAESDKSEADATQADEPEADASSNDEAEFEEPFQSSVTERALALFVIATMVGAMAYGVWIVVRYWGDVGV